MTHSALLNRSNFESMVRGNPPGVPRTPSFRNHSLGFIKPIDWKPPTTSRSVPDAIVP
jgi:hypothetical protein